MAAVWILTTLLDWRFYLFLVVLYVVIFYIKVLFSGLPPGPLPMPLVGNILQYSKYGTNMHLAFCEIAKKYRDVFTFYFGHQPVTILASYEAVKEAFVKNGDATSGRPEMYILEYLGLQGKGLVQGAASIWKEHRQFAMRVLRDLGMGKSVLEDRIQEEAGALVDVIRSENGQPFDPRRYIGPAVSNIICALVYGHRFSYTDPEFVKMLDNLDENFNNFRKITFVNQYPWLRFLPGDVSKLKSCSANWAHIIKFIKKEINDHYQHSTSDDYIDCFLNEQKKRENTKEKSSFTESQLIYSVWDLFAAGTETTTTLLRWSIVYILNHPECFKKLQEELDDVVGQHRPPSMKDKISMPYTEAFLCEVHRMTSVAALGIFHQCTSDITVCGKSIPNGSFLVPNLYATHHDPERWNQPDEFNPERFIDNNGKLMKMDKLLAFGIGPRVCLGESLARMEQFIFLTSLVQNFTFHPAESMLPNTVGHLGIVLSPEPFRVTVRERK